MADKLLVFEASGNLCFVRQNTKARGKDETEDAFLARIWEAQKLANNLPDNTHHLIVSPDDLPAKWEETNWATRRAWKIQGGKVVAP